MMSTSVVVPQRLPLGLDSMHVAIHDAILGAQPGMSSIGEVCHGSAYDSTYLRYFIKKFTIKMESESRRDGFRIKFFECKDEDCKESDVMRSKDVFGRWRHVVHGGQRVR